MGIHILTAYYPREAVPQVPLVVISEEEDGYMISTAAFYSTARDAASGTVHDVASYMTIGQQRVFPDYTIYRGGLFFDATSLPEEAVITAALLSLWPVFGGEFSAILDADQALVIVSGEDLDASGLVAGDYGELKARSTSFGSIDKAGWDAAIAGSVMAEIELNSLALARISKTAITRFGLRGLHDIDNVPDGPATVERNRFDFQTAEYSIEARRPHLIISYNI